MLFGNNTFQPNFLFDCFWRLSCLVLARERKKTLWELGSGDSETSQLSSFVTRKLFKHIFRCKCLFEWKIFVTDILRESQSDPESRGERATNWDYGNKIFGTTSVPDFNNQRSIFLPVSRRHGSFEPSGTSQDPCHRSNFAQIGVETCVRRRSSLTHVCVPTGISTTDEITVGCCNLRVEIFTPAGHTRVVDFFALLLPFDFLILFSVLIKCTSYSFTHFFFFVFLRLKKLERTHSHQTLAGAQKACEGAGKEETRSELPTKIAHMWQFWTDDGEKSIPKNIRMSHVAPPYQTSHLSIVLSSRACL